MPADDRILRLLDTLEGGLSQEKLESLTREFNSLAQDRAETLVFFVLQKVCERLASALEGEGVSARSCANELNSLVSDSSFSWLSSPCNASSNRNMRSSAGISVD